MTQSSQNYNQNYVGIDLSKQTFEAVRLIDLEKEWKSGKTSAAGLVALVRWLKKNDIVILEAGNQSFRIAKYLLSEVGCEVLVLNPGSIFAIYASLKKTDKEDCLKLARLAQRNPVSELPVVQIPSDDEEELRCIISEHQFIVKQTTKLRNRFHAVFTRVGLLDIKKSHVKSPKHRIDFIKKITGQAKREAERINNQLTNLEIQIKELDTEIKNVLKENKEYAQITMSMPGIGPLLTAGLLAYYGDFKRFANSKQVAFYSGLVPSVKISGDMKIYGHVMRRNNPVRANIVQAAWSLVRSEDGGAMKTFYENLYPRAGKKRAIVAVARKMLITIYTMFQTGELYRSMPIEKLEKKIRYYGLV